MKSQRRKIAPNQPNNTANARFLGQFCRKETNRNVNLLLSVMVITLLQAGVAFGAGERFLGVQVTNNEQGVIIQQIVQNSPATRVVDPSSGQYISLEPGDVILMINGVNVTTPAQFVQLIKTGPPVAFIRVWDVRNRMVRDVAAGVGPSNEVAAYLNRRSPNMEDRRGSPYISPTTPRQPQGMSVAQRRAKIQMFETRISILDRKIRDQERSIRKYEEWGNERPGVSNMMLQQSARKLLQTYERQKMKLEMQKGRLEAGM